MWSQRDHKILIGAEGDCALVGEVLGKPWFPWKIDAFSCVTSANKNTNTDKTLL